MSDLDNASLDNIFSIQKEEVVELAGACSPRVNSWTTRGNRGAIWERLEDRDVGCVAQKNPRKTEV